MDVGFADGAGRIYRPSVVRVGSEDAPIQQRARDVWVDTLIKYAGCTLDHCRRASMTMCKLAHVQSWHGTGAMLSICRMHG